ncbi:RICIN domain-containing protein (plasmid) [Sorangium sp. So ce119]|uniref:RICIN domain-containing protein n=1 Tax=Sorangium sp. So ce119 TaxID=3133279 RepID=UPI003F6070AC
MAADVEESSEYIDTGSDAIFAASLNLWQDRDIPVCWENPGDDDAERGWAQDQVTKTWDAVSSINFTGWGTCESDSPGIHIRIEDTRPHAKYLGNQLDGVSAGLVLNFTFNEWGTECQLAQEYCIRGLAVHEFGHALGFAHEHNRFDTPSSCVEERQGADGDLVIGSWDLDSAMNYCNPRDGNGKLSETDIFGVRLAYDWGFSGLIVSEENDKCLDVVQGSAADGAGVVTSSCNGNDNQRWKLVPRRDGYYNIVNRKSGKCLDVKGASKRDGAAVVQWRCNGGDNQAWRVEANDGGTHLAAKHSGKCLNLASYSQDDGVALEQEACAGSSTEVWWVKP